MDSGSDPSFVQSTQYVVPLWYTHNEQMPGVFVPWQHDGEANGRHIAEEVAVSFRGAPTMLGPLIQMAQLCRQDHSLKRVQARVEPYGAVLILPLASMIPEFPDPCRERFVVREDASGVSVRTQVLPWIETSA